MNQENDSDRELPEIADDELRRRVIYSLFGPVARLVQRYGLPVKEMTSLLEIASFHVLKKASYTLTEAADTLGVSRRKVAGLSKQLKQNFFAPEQAEGLPRRIEYMLWAGPMTAGRIGQALPEQQEAVDEALDRLVAEERVVLLEDDYTRRYAVPDRAFRLYANNWIARIDGLNNLLGNLTDAIVGRFFEEDNRAFARTLDFRMRRQDLDELEQLYEEEIFQRLSQLEERTESADEEEVINMSLSALWAPNGLADPQEE